MWAAEAMQPSMPFGLANSEDLTDSAYAQELKRGVGRLRFAPPLERQYLAAHLQHVRRRVRVWFSLWLALGILSTITLARRSGTASAPFWMTVAGVACALVLAWLPWSRYYERYFMSSARVLVPIRGALIAILVAQVAGQGYEDELMLLTLILIGVFFFTGLLFRAALLTGLGMVAAFVMTAVSVGFISPIAVRSVVVLLMATVIGTIVRRDIETSARRNFLEDALLAELSMRDAVTGLMNRRALDEHLLRLWQQGQRDQRLLALLMVDIDHFKQFNDRHGHQAGDAVLRRVGQILQDYARRPLDMAARYGGEEFVLILYDMPQPAHVADIAERIRQSVQQTPSPLPASATSSPLTVSIGVGIVEPMLERTPQGALQFADEALYQAKEQGRNRVVFNDPSRYLESETGPFRKSGTSRH